VDDVLVGGVWRPAADPGRLDVVDPATEEVWGSAPDCTARDVEAAVESADTALRTGPWPSFRPAERAAVLVRMADLLEARAEELAWTISRENGSPLAETRGAAANAASILRYTATLAPILQDDDVRPFPGAAGQESLVRRDPIGVCALIAPWNFPINLVATKLAPALLAGCSVVVKPAPSTPLSVRFLMQAAVDAGVPAGVVNLVTGAGEAGDALVRHRLVAKVAFTGSTPVGRKIGAICGELLKPVTLELGGKSSALLLDDVDLDQLAAVLIRSSLRNSGQTCYISTRLLVPASRYDEVVARVVEVVEAAPLGDPFDESTVFGPLATGTQYEKVLGYLATAQQDGARVATGGRAVEGPGWFVEPTVLADVTATMRVATEEIFGPVLCLMRYSTVDEAVDLANSTRFGLGGIVFSADADRALQVAERMDTGSVGINFFASNHAAPFGGRHDSGLGTEYGPEGLSAYLSLKSIHRTTR
jgi:aldehyde dehydrogenase (NAD+)